MGSTKYIYFFFGCAGLLLAYLLALTYEWVWGYFGKPSDLIVDGAAIATAAVAMAVGIKRRSMFETVSEIFGELEKVTWPTRKETWAATMVVIVMVTVSAIILAGFDAVWSFLTGRILS